MLQFIFGKPASGKTYTIINKIKQVIGQDKECVLIVPEQFTFESERALLQAFTVLGSSIYGLPAICGFLLLRFIFI